jgi:hypothetical protein
MNNNRVFIFFCFFLFILTLPLAAKLKDTLYAYPNPFFPDKTKQMSFGYSLEVGGQMSLVIFDTSGRKICTVSNQVRKESGKHMGDKNDRWDGCNEDGVIVPAGLYIARFTINYDMNDSKTTALSNESATVVFGLVR